MESDAVVGEVACVIYGIEPGVKGKVRLFGKAYSASSDERVLPGQWVRILHENMGTLFVRPLNVWLGSCGK